MGHEKGFKEYRKRLAEAATTPPVIPYLGNKKDSTPYTYAHTHTPISFAGIFLTDLTFVDDGNPDFDEDDLINFQKWQQTGIELIPFFFLSFSVFLHCPASLLPRCST